MKLEINKGFTVYRSTKNLGLIFVALHAGPALGNPTHRDDHSETVASLCWENMGGSFIVSNISRDRLWGIDFNRDIPSLKNAIEMFDEFSKGEITTDRAFKYMKKYAWVAKDENDYYSRLRIYQNFWA